MVNKSKLISNFKYRWRSLFAETSHSIWICETNTLLLTLAMADKRKLQCEIDRTLKKIVEGIEVFDDMWEKVHSATNCNMKEKQEAELKKEIKKLQRLRDFVKNWLASNEIKDKNSLLEHKKLIETKMEQFKIIERETKTKAYSTVGLGSAVKVDPKEKEKDDIRNWLSNQIDTLKLQVDQIESEIESIVTKKKKVEREKVEQVEHFRQHLEQHRFHIGRLELTMRLVDNDVLDLQLINKIKDSVEYFVSLGYDQPPSPEDSMMYLYDELNLDEESEALGSKLTSKLLYDGDERTSETSDAGRDSVPSPISSPTFHSLKEEDEKPKMTTQLSLDSRQTNGPSHHHHHSHHHSCMRSSSSLSSHHQQKHFNEVVTGGGASAGDNSKNSEELKRSSSVFTVGSSTESSSTTTTTTKSIPPLLTQNYAKVASSHVNIKSAPSVETKSSSSSTTTTTPSSSTMTSTSELTSTIVANPVTCSLVISPSSHLSLKQLSLSAAMRTSQSGSTGIFDGKTLISSPQAGATFPSSIDSTSNTNADLNSLSLSSQSNQSARFDSSTSLQLMTPSQASSTKTIHIHPLLGVAPLGRQPLDKMQKIQLVMVEAAFHRLPQPMDSERNKPGLQRNPGNLPPYYTPLNPPAYDSIEFFNQLQIETLFFIFYYMEGTKAQYLAAKALKLKSWRFHTKLLMWFQRYEEPKIITEEFEQGSYLFFDFESWAQRQQDEFMFEYRYLEDHDLN